MQYTVLKFRPHVLSAYHYWMEKDMHGSLQCGVHYRVKCGISGVCLDNWWLISCLDNGRLRLARIEMKSEPLIIERTARMPHTTPCSAPLALSALQDFQFPGGSIILREFRPKYIVLPSTICQLISYLVHSEILKSNAYREVLTLLFMTFVFCFYFASYLILSCMLNDQYHMNLQYYILNSSCFHFDQFNLQWSVVFNIQVNP